MSQVTTRPGSPVGGIAANAGTSAGTPAKGQSQAQKYGMFNLGIGKANREAFNSLGALATRLGCRATNLAWLAIGNLLKNPPTSAPAGASSGQASAAGFFVAATVNPQGKATGLKIVEVAERRQAKSQFPNLALRTFFRYEPGDVKMRGRAKNQAIKACKADAKLAGLGDDTFNPEVTMLPGDGAPARAPAVGTPATAAANA